MKGKIIFFFSQIIFLVYSCTDHKNYSFIKWDFNIVVPKTIPSLYDYSDNPEGFGITIQRVLVLKIKPNEFKQYFGHLNFVSINNGLNEYNVDLLENGFKFHYIYKYKGKTDTITKPFHEKKLHYDFNFKKGLIYVESENFNRLIFYDPEDEVIIFYAFSNEYKYLMD